MQEWLNWPLSKSGKAQAFEGSNPSLSAMLSSVGYRAYTKDTMSMWNDLFEIYQSADDESATSQTLPSDDVAGNGDEKPQQTVYVFAYVDDGKGNISRNIAVEDRITMLELKNQELEHRYNALLEQISDDTEDSAETET